MACWFSRNIQGICRIVTCGILIFRKYPTITQNWNMWNIDFLEIHSYSSESEHVEYRFSRNTKRIWSWTIWNIGIREIPNGTCGKYRFSRNTFISRQYQYERCYGYLYCFLYNQLHYIRRYYCWRHIMAEPYYKRYFISKQTKCHVKGGRGKREQITYKVR